MKQIKVTMCEFSGRGGLAQYTYELCNALSTSGCEVTLFTGENYELTDLPRAFSVQDVFRRHTTSLVAISRTLATAVRNKPGVVHIQGSDHPELYAPFMTALAALGCRPLVYTAHDVWPPETRWYHKSSLSLIYRRLADQLIVHAAHSKRALLHDFRVPADRITVVDQGTYCFRTVEGPSPSGAAHSDHTPAKRILFFGLITPDKGLEHLIDAFAIVHEHHPEAQLVVVGKPLATPARYISQVASRGLQDCVDLRLEYVPLSEVPAIFDECDVVVLPYLRTYQSAVTMMAYGHGKPVVVTDVGGLPEVVEDGRSGIVVPPGDVASLAAAIQRLLSNPRLLRQMSLRVEELSSTRFSWSIAAARTVRLYNSAIQARKTGAERIL